MKRTFQVFVALAALGAAGIASAHGRGHARLSIGFGFPIAPPVYAAPVYAAPPPVYYMQPQVVYVTPPPVYYQPAYVYYGPPVVYRPAPVVLGESRERRDVVPAPARPPSPAPALPRRPYRN